jgi:hypothetical protein
MTKIRLRELLDKKKRSYKEDKELRQLQDKFILKSKVNPRLFDTNFKKTSKRKFNGVERRENGKKQ